MDNRTFEVIIDEQIKRCRDILVVKAKEYATEDRLHNFKVAAALQGISPIQALAGMMAKHTVSVYDMCMSKESFTNELWNEKITDSINYLLLLQALVKDAKSEDTDMVNVQCDGVTVMNCTDNMLRELIKEGGTKEDLKRLLDEE